jgi:hypothetical protein
LWRQCGPGEASACILKASTPIRKSLDRACSATSFNTQPNTLSSTIKMPTLVHDRHVGKL